VCSIKGPRLAPQALLVRAVRKRRSVDRKRLLERRRTIGKVVHSLRPRAGNNRDAQRSPADGNDDTAALSPSRTRFGEPNG